ncbi:MAG TPA: hypothetical protein VH722_17480, partial [Alphaproteobacteria bacterium]|nr:hypothetical protein [Alphaproteobacteria bacterium]
ADGTKINSGGIQIDYYGGIVEQASVARGGIQKIYGTASGTRVASGGRSTVFAHGSSVGAIVSRAGMFYVGSSTPFGAGLSATATGTTLNGGADYVSAQAIASGTIVNSGGIEHVNGGESIDAIINSGGTQLVVAETVRFSDHSSSAVHGLSIGATVNRGGTVVVQHAIARNTVVKGGRIELLSQGKAQNLFVLSGGTLVFAGGTTRGVTMLSGATEIIDSGITVSGLKVGKGVSLVVSSSATASGTILSGGTETVRAGGHIGGRVDFKENSTLSVAITGKEMFTASGFAASDRLDLSNFKFGPSEAMSFAENKAKTGGILTVTDGALTAKVILLGHYVAAGFHRASDHGAGTVITYRQPAASHLEITGSPG